MISPGFCGSGIEVQPNWAYLAQGLSCGCGYKATVAEIISKASLLTQQAPDLGQLQQLRLLGDLSLFLRCLLV